MKRILVPTDFSENALKAASYAAEIARRTGATLHLAHAPELGHEKVHQPFRLHDKYTQLVTEDRREELVAFAKKVTDIHKDIPVVTALLSSPVTVAICEYCASQDIDVVVMGTKGASGLKEVLVGSVTAELIAKTKVPVLAIPDSYIFEEPDAIVLATSQLEQDEALLTRVVDVAKIFAAAIHVIVFIETDETDANARLYTARQLDEYLELLNKMFPAVVFAGELLAGTDFEAAIESYEIKNAVDIVAMITYPKGFWDRVLQKSATRKMAFHSRIPILAIPANASAVQTAASGDTRHDP